MESELECGLLNTNQTSPPLLNWLDKLINEGIRSNRPIFNTRIVLYSFIIIQFDFAVFTMQANYESRLVEGRS